MDLVSSTLDRYLKHRFSGSGLANRSTDSSGNKSDNVDQTLDPSQSNTEKTAPLSDVNSLDHQVNQEDPTNSSNSYNTPELNQNNQSPIMSNTIRSNNEFTRPHQIYNYSGHSSGSLETNGLSDDAVQFPSIQRLMLDNLKPCCVSLRDDLHYLAAGYEDSHIYLWDMKGDESTTEAYESRYKLLAHSGPVYGIEFTTKNDLMLSCSEDTTIRLWCLNTKCNVYVYRGHTYPIWSLAIGSQQTFFASVSMDATARLWHLEQMTPLRIFCGHDDDVECVKFHPNEKYIATGSSDATVRLWSTSDGKMVRLMVGHDKPITSLSFFPDGKFLASASREGMIKVWNLVTNCPSREFSVPPSYTVSFSPDHRFIASCGTDNILRLWQISEANLVEKKQIDQDSRSKQRLIKSQFHKDNKLFVICFNYEREDYEQ